MKTILTITFITLCSLFTLAQNPKEAAELVAEGVSLHDKGDYEGAIEKYNAALKKDEDNINALYEKSYSLYALGKQKDCISICKTIIKKYPDNALLKAVYIQYGNALDDLKKPKDALEVYEEGISKFPGEFLLYYNKGLTLQNLSRFDEALEVYQQSLSVKPLHSSSNLSTGLLLERNNKIPALLAYCTFLAIEPNSKRSPDAFRAVNDIIGANVKKEGNNISIMLNPEMLNDKKNKDENNFRTQELIFTFSSALDNSKEVDSIAHTAAEKFDLKLQLLINSLETGMKEGKGFYWKHYVPFFVAMKKDNQTAVLSHLVFASAKDEDNSQWLGENEEKISAFYDWLKAYKWK